MRLQFPEFRVKREDLTTPENVGKLFGRFQALLGSHIGEQVGEQVDDKISRKLRDHMGPGGKFGDDRTGSGDGHRWKGMIPYSLGAASPAAAGSSTLTADLKGLDVDQDTPLFIGTNGIVTVVTGVTYDGRTQYIGPGNKLPAKVFDPSTSDEYVGLNLEGRATREITITADVSAAGNWYLWTYVPAKIARANPRNG